MPGGLALDTGEDDATLKSRSRAIHFRPELTHEHAAAVVDAVLAGIGGVRVRLPAPALIGRDPCPIRSVTCLQ